jgi:hypothetical protein
MIRASRNSAKRNRVKIDNFFAELKRRNVYKVAGQQVSGIEIRSLRLIQLVRV